MPPKKASKATTRCEHTDLTFSSTPHATEAGYKRPTLDKRLAATTSTGTIKSIPKDAVESLGTFPAPLILPDDDLALEPRHPTQNFRSWAQLMNKRKVTPERHTIYLAVAPECDPDVEFVQSWTKPRHNFKTSGVAIPQTQDVLEYLQAFYYPLPVKLFPREVLRFTADVGDMDDMPKGDKPRKIIGLKFREGYESKGIRTRPRPKGDYTHQLNLDDLLDAAIWALPKDAYALVMLVDHDLYEDEEDEFVCGRAYGGSSVALITSARYNPLLDKKQDVAREHAWPASHCDAHLKVMLGDATKPNARTKKEATAGSEQPQTGSQDITPLHAAVKAHHALPSLEDTPSAADLSGLWLGRVCRTASHEAGHIFGMDHCVYYACSMQGSASIIEDARQPPYLCPVDLAKMLQATGADMKERYQAIMAYCEKHKDVHMFAAFRAWIQGRLKELERNTS